MSSNISINLHNMRLSCDSLHNCLQCFNYSNYDCHYYRHHHYYFYHYAIVVSSDDVLVYLRRSFNGRLLLCFLLPYIEDIRRTVSNWYASLGRQSFNYAGLAKHTQVESCLSVLPATSFGRMNYTKRVWFNGWQAWTVTNLPGQRNFALRYV